MAWLRRHGGDFMSWVLLALLLAVLWWGVWPDITQGRKAQWPTVGEMVRIREVPVGNSTRGE